MDTLPTMYAGDQRRPSAPTSGVFGAPCSPSPLEITMLLLFLIGAALRHVRPEPPIEATLPTDPDRTHRKAWGCTKGQLVFWHWLPRPKY